MREVVGDDRGLNDFYALWTKAGRRAVCQTDRPPVGVYR